MNIPQVMKCYKQTLEYYKEPILEHINSSSYPFRDRKDMNKLLYAFIEMCPFPELFVAMVNKKNPQEFIEEEIQKYKKQWDTTVAKICSEA